MPLGGVNWPNSSKLGRGLIHSSSNPQVKSQPRWDFDHCLQKEKGFNLYVISFQSPSESLNSKRTWLRQPSPAGGMGFRLFYGLEMWN